LRNKELNKTNKMKRGKVILRIFCITCEIHPTFSSSF